MSSNKDLSKNHLSNLVCFGLVLAAWPNNHASRQISKIETQANAMTNNLLEAEFSGRCMKTLSQTARQDVKRLNQTRNVCP